MIDKHSHDNHFFSTWDLGTQALNETKLNGERNHYQWWSVLLLRTKMMTAFQLKQLELLKTCDPTTGYKQRLLQKPPFLKKFMISTVIIGFCRSFMKCLFYLNFTHAQEWEGRKLCRCVQFACVSPRILKLKFTVFMGENKQRKPSEKIALRKCIVDSRKPSAQND